MHLQLVIYPPVFSGNGACVDNTPFMTPAQSVENFYQEELEEEDDEALSVAGTEYSEAPSVARSYTISHNSNQVKTQRSAAKPKNRILLLDVLQKLD